MIKSNFDRVEKENMLVTGFQQGSFSGLFNPLPDDKF